MITKLTKYQSNTTSVWGNNKHKRKFTDNGGTLRFQLYLPVEIKKYLDNTIVVKKVDFGFTLRSSTLNDNSNLHKIHKNGRLTLGRNNVNEFEDLGDYEIDPDYENEVVYLVKIV